MGRRRWWKSLFLGTTLVALLLLGPEMAEGGKQSGEKTTLAICAWDRLRQGMPQDELVALIGQPPRKMAGKSGGVVTEQWHYSPSGRLDVRDGKLLSWVIPAELCDVHVRKGEVRDGSKWAELADSSDEELRRIRNRLEVAYEKAAASPYEATLRRQLRALRHRLGPNRDPEKAFQWRIIALLAQRVSLKWQDRDGREYQFEAEIQNPDPWLAWIDREMELFSKYVFQKSWGKIRIAYKVHSTAEPVTSFKKSGDEYWFNERRAAKLVKGKFPRREAVSLFVWVPKDGQGRFPRTGANATAVPGTSFTNGAHLTAFYTSEERMKTPGSEAAETIIPHVPLSSIRSTSETSRSRNPGWSTPVRYR